MFLAKEEEIKVQKTSEQDESDVDEVLAAWNAVSNPAMTTADKYRGYAAAALVAFLGIVLFYRDQRTQVRAAQSQMTNSSGGDHFLQCGE